MLSDSFLRKVLFPGAALPDGGQELIAVEIISALAARKCKRLWLPFSLGPLAMFARAHGVETVEGIEAAEVRTNRIDSLYLGTPTIVAGKKLFPDSARGVWNKRIERGVVRSLCTEAEKKKARVIITGLGSGDITIGNRCADMTLPGWSRPKAICMKDFGTFVDWVLLTEKE